MPLMTASVGVLLLLAFGTILVLALGRHAELARLRLRSGRIEFVRGRLPPKLLHDLRDQLANCSAPDAEIRIMLDQGRPRATVKGLSEGHAQQIRNVVGMYEAAQIRAGKPPPPRRP